MDRTLFQLLYFWGCTIKVCGNSATITVQKLQEIELKYIKVIMNESANRRLTFGATNSSQQRMFLQII